LYVSISIHMRYFPPIGELSESIEIYFDLCCLMEGYLELSFRLINE